MRTLTRRSLSMKACDNLAIIMRTGGVMGASRIFSAVVAACVLSVAATATSARAQSDRPPIFDMVPGAEPRAKSNVGPAQEQGPDDLDALNHQALRLRQAGKYAEATEIAKQSLALAERKFGPDHSNVAPSLNNLAFLYQNQGRYDEAEPLYTLSLAICEKALGQEHPDTARSLNNLAALYESQGRYAKAEPLYKRTVTIFENAWAPTTPPSAPPSTTSPGTMRARASTPRPSRSTSAR